MIGHPGPWCKQLIDSKPTIRLKGTLWVVNYPSAHAVAGRPFQFWNDAVKFVLKLWTTAVERDAYYWKVQAEAKIREDREGKPSRPRLTMVL